MAAFLLLAMLSAAPLAMAADKTTVSIGPGDSHEDCSPVGPGQTFNYSFTSTAPVAFSIHYHKEPRAKIVFVLKKRPATKLEGGYSPKEKHEYCLMWTNTQTTPLIVSYSKSVSGK